MDPESTGSTVAEAEPPAECSSSVDLGGGGQGAAGRHGFRVFAGDLGVSARIRAVTTNYGGYARQPPFRATEKGQESNVLGCVWI